MIRRLAKLDEKTDKELTYVLSQILSKDEAQKLIPFINKPITQNNVNEFVTVPIAFNQFDQSMVVKLGDKLYKVALQLV
jgi:hypothetical protein